MCLLRLTVELFAFSMQSCFRSPADYCVLECRRGICWLAGVQAVQASAAVHSPVWRDWENGRQET